jgi:crotonobetainyl-CoA:carnitine CoA-transferase CaiB-like acyl-CoA transferase
MNVETSIGKKSAFCDLDSESGKEGFSRVLQDADVYVNFYLSLESKGFGPRELVKRRPGIAYVDFHARGKAGPGVSVVGLIRLRVQERGFRLRGPLMTLNFLLLTF